MLLKPAAAGPITIGTYAAPEVLTPGQGAVEAQARSSQSGVQSFSWPLGS